MKSLFKTIFARMTTDTDLYTDIAGRLYNGKAQPGTDYPYVVFKLVTNNPNIQYTGFTEDFENALYQFDIFSDKSSPAEAEDICYHLRSLYDNYHLPVPGRTIHWMRWTGSTIFPEDHTTKPGTKEVWHCAVEYEILEELRTGENEALFVDTESGTFEDTTDGQYEDRV